MKRNINIKICRNMDLWNNMVIKSPFALVDHFWSNASLHIIIEHGFSKILFPFKKIQFRKIPMCILLSYGLRMSGGPTSLNDMPSNLINYLLENLLNYMKNSKIDLVNFTIKTYIDNKFSKKIIKILINKKDVDIDILNARILRITSNFDEIWSKSFNKKVRNLVRKFKKSGGIVADLKDPIDYINDIMECNLSQPIRQGKPLPISYIDRNLVYNGLISLKREYNERFRFYGAFIDNKLVGYAYILWHNGHAYISRFLIHRKYKRYGTSEGLLSGIIEDLSQTNKINIIQYAYWAPRSSPGVDHFLRQHGFKNGKEIAFFIPLTYKGKLLLYALKQRRYIEEIAFRTKLIDFMKTLIKKRHHIKKIIYPELFSFK